ncbi:MAG: phosphatidylinositol-3-phosphatase, partial [Solirubrobacterales bacterium]|nr:phosphatidylinositol-3-phosphatase [Solirubrobacterales bacterium]
MRRLLPIATLLAALSLAGAAADPAGAASPRGSHVFVIVMENHEYGEVIGSGQAPFLNRLAKRYASTTRMYAISHPSLPNYLAMLGGSTFGISSDCTDCDGIPGRTLTGQLDAKRIGWQAFMEGMPSTCFRGAGAGGYAKKHNPFAYFRESYGAGACRNVLPASRLGGLLGSGRLAEFNWITPDLCNDTHDCGVGVGDRYLARLVPRLLARTGPKGFVVVTYDEGSSSAGCCGHAHGGHIATVIAGPPVQRGAVSRPYTLYSLLRTIEDVFGVGHLRMAGCACTEPMDKLFKGGRAPRIGSGGGPAPDPGDGGGIDHTVPTAALLRDEADGSRSVRFRVVDEGSGIDPSSLLAEASRDDGPWLALDGAAFDAATGTLGGDLPAILGEGTIRVRLTARDLAGNVLRYGFDDPVT